jgi:hypothetical protein
MTASGDIQKARGFVWVKGGFGVKIAIISAPKKDGEPIEIEQVLKDKKPCNLIICKVCKNCRINDRCKACKKTWFNQPSRHAAESRIPALGSFELSLRNQGCPTASDHQYLNLI